MKRNRILAAVLSAVLLTTLAACAPTPTREGTGEYVDDTVITTKVKAALLGDRDLKATEINVETFKGVVQLSGFVAKPESIPRAVELTRGIAGVKSVKNDILVKR